MIATLVFADLLFLFLAFALSVLIRYGLGKVWLEPLQEVGRYFALWPIIGCFIASYVMLGAYPGLMGLPTMGFPDLMRRMVFASTSVFLVLGLVLFMFRMGEMYSRAIFLIGWSCAVVIVPFGRLFARSVFSSRDWWGHAALVLTTPSRVGRVVEMMHAMPGLDIKPVGILMPDPKDLESVRQVPVLGAIDQLSECCRQLNCHYAIVDLPVRFHGKLFEESHHSQVHFPELLFAPRSMGRSMELSDADGQMQLLKPMAGVIKRVTDLGTSIFLLALFAPLICVIAIAIRIDSRGPVFYGHPRIGRRGRRFNAWKFRSMIKNADVVLDKYLSEHPELQQEWVDEQKLKDDPRITKIGRILRRYSLDELPQLWNVLMNQMSMVGPRPILDEEVGRYGRTLNLYLQIKPGLSGLWQVSGRNDVSYRQRVVLDTYYVRNWSIWLDMFILVRTIGVVLRGRGAY